MFRHIRTKLAAVLAVPLVALVALAGVQVAGSVHQRSAVSSERALSTASLGPAGVVSALQTERDEASLTLIGLQHSVALGVSSDAAAALQTDAAAAQFRQTVNGSQAASDVYQPALADLGQLGSLRVASRSFSGDRSLTNRNAVQAASQLYARYTTVVNAVLDSTSRVAPSIKDQTLRSGAEILAASLRQTEAQTNVVHDVFDATFNGGLTAASGSLATTAADLGNYQAWTSRLQTLEVAPYASAVQTLVAPTSVNAFTSLVRSYLGGATPDFGRLLASTAAGGTPAQANAYQAATRSVAATIIDRSSQLGRSANQQLEIYALIALLALVLGAALVVGASRSIARPIIRLAGQASELADHRLASAVDRILRGDQPDETELPPIVVKGRDETAQLAGAIAAVQDSAVSLAVEQAGLRRNMADAFTNLGRRSQNLVTRQLDYITSVEKTEADPDQLEQLFRLDHLATRMRRNAESLLVLGGSTSPRQWSKPVPVIDAVRAALSEVEDFRRVRLGTIEPSATAGRAASDIAHIMAELIENALTNSPPQTPVRISGHNQADGYVLTVADDGLGMDAEGLARANQRLSGNASFTDSPSRSLGHFVAGRLAVRHDISVEVQPGDRGVRALVHLPVSVLPDRPASQPSNGVAPA
ncbi:MAG: sensor histidine kinase, partial [Acidimicrobiales bacterium]